MKEVSEWGIFDKSNIPYVKTIINSELLQKKIRNMFCAFKKKKHIYTYMGVM